MVHYNNVLQNSMPYSETLQKDRPLGLNYSIINELIHRQEPEYKLYEGMKDGITKCDAIIRNATKKFQNKAWNFAEHYYNTVI